MQVVHQVTLPVSLPGNGGAQGCAKVALLRHTFEGEFQMMEKADAPLQGPAKTSLKQQTYFQNKVISRSQGPFPLS